MCYQGIEIGALCFSTSCAAINPTGQRERYHRRNALPANVTVREVRRLLQKHGDGTVATFPFRFERVFLSCTFKAFQREAVIAIFSFCLPTPVRSMSHIQKSAEVELNQLEEPVRRDAFTDDADMERMGKRQQFQVCMLASDMDMTIDRDEGLKDRPAQLPIRVHCSL